MSVFGRPSRFCSIALPVMAVGAFVMELVRAALPEVGPGTAQTVLTIAVISLCAGVLVLTPLCRRLNLLNVAPLFAHRPRPADSPSPDPQEQLATARRLVQQGFPSRQIARLSGVARTTADELIAEYETSRH
jgi:hypothetical protein